MKNTSLQTIVSGDPNHLDQIEIQKLFEKRTYPHFELQDLKARPELLKKSSYASFLNLLENWNKTVDDPSKEVNDCQYRKNQFIFSWLKWVAVQNAKYVDSSLIRLQNWYNSSRLKQPGFFLKKQNVLKSYAEEWEIRNSYRSNLPLEIDNYKRRAIFNIKTITNSPKGNKQKQNVVKDTIYAGQKYLQEAKSNKKEHAYLRQVREEQQMQDYLSSFKKSKMQFYKNLVKDFYKKQFSQNKLEIETPAKEQLHKSSLIKDYRLKTSTDGFRHLSRGQSPLLNRTAMLPFFQNKNTNFQSDLTETDHNTTINQSKSLNTSNIDGIGLLVNPFDTKVKKKKCS